MASRQDARELASFLRKHPPFHALDPQDVERVAAAAEVESYHAGDVVFVQGAEPLKYLWVVHTGTIEIVTDGRVVDVLGEGEPFGYASMLSGFPPGFAARAAQDTMCIRIGHETARALLAAPEGLQFVARSLLEEPTELHALAREPAENLADQPVGSLIREPAVVCPPDLPIREAARRMSGGRSTAVVVDLGPEGLGILTDRDLRTRVLAGGMSVDEPVAAAMSAPAYTCTADRRAGEVLLEMFERGLRHLPVLSASGAVIGMIEEVDLVAARTRSSFYLRRRIATAAGDAELVRIARELRPMVIALHDARVSAANVMAVYAVCVDALTRRLLELVIARSEPVGADFAWLALGSQARREALPSSDVDSAIVWFTGDGQEPHGVQEPDGVRDRLLAVAREVTTGLRACGLELDANGVRADAEPFVRSVASWQGVARSWIEDPTQEKALILSSVLLDSRPVWGVHTGTPVSDTFRLAMDHPDLLGRLARFALSHRPSARMFRGLVVETGGEHRGQIDLKHGGIVPILDLARWGAIAAGVTSASTPERLQAAGEAGTLAADDAHTLRDAFELINNVRLEHQVAQLRVRRPPDDFVAPDELSALMRTQLRQALRAVAGIQRRVAADPLVGAR